MIYLLFFLAGVLGMPVNTLDKALAPEKDVRELSAASFAKVAVGETCRLGQSWRLEKGCGKSPFILPESLPSCDDAPDEPCLKRIDNGGNWRDLSQRVDSEAESDAFMKATASVEGEGWGVTASLSASTMSASTMSTSSVSYIIYGGGTFYTHQLRNEKKLQLTDDAKAALDMGQAYYRQIYGTVYVNSISYGAAFMGEYTMDTTTKSTSTHDTLDASMSYEGAVDAKAEGSFEQKVKSKSSQLKTKSSGNVKGGRDAFSFRFAGKTPREMVVMYEQYMEGMKNQSPVAPAAPMYATLHGQTYSDDFHDLVRGMNESDQEFFIRDTPKAYTMDEYQKAVLGARRFAQQIARSKAWGFTSLNAKLNTWKTQIAAIESQLADYSMDKLLDAQDAISAGTWAVSKQLTEMKDTYVALVTPYTTCIVDLLDGNRIVERKTFTRHDSLAKRSPHMLDDATEDLVDGIEVHNSGDSLGCGTVVIGDDDGPHPGHGCKSNGGKAYEDNGKCNKGQKCTWDNDRISSDLEEDFCGIWVPMPYLDGLD